MANPKEVADMVVRTAENALSPLETTMRNWPADFRAIIWEAVARSALRRALTAREIGDRAP